MIFISSTPLDCNSTTIEIKKLNPPKVSHIWCQRTTLAKCKHYLSGAPEEIFFIKTLITFAKHLIA